MTDEAHEDPGADLPLPGLDPEPVSRAVSDLERQARRSLQALDAAGLLEPRHAALAELFLTLARAVHKQSMSPKGGYAVANLANSMREVWVQLLPEEEGGGSDDFAAWKRELERAGMDSPGGTS
jgi:hypothetical protein